MPPPAEPAAPGRFVVREEIARDPRFVRLRAFDNLLQCEVVLEQPGEAVRARLGDAAGDRALREARALARVAHPRVTRLREVVDLGGLPTLVFDPLPGERLAERLAREPRLPAEAVVRLGRDLAQAAQAVHAEGIVHRGIAAENVVIDARDGAATLAGFTFAKPIDSRTGQSSLDHGARRAGGAALHGLPEYAAPEQLAGQPADHRADVFGLGCLLYRCATGRDAFAGEGRGDRPPRSPRELEPSVPTGLSELIVRCIAHSPLARLPNMLAVDAALAALQDRPRRRAAARARALALSAVLLSALGVLALVSRGGADGGEPHSDWLAAAPDWRPTDPNPVGAHAPEYRARRALLVGIDYVGSPHYDRRRLNNAERDVTAVGQRLADLGWQRPGAASPDGEVRLLRGPEATREAIARALQWVRSAGPDAQVLVYLAGHGQVSRTDPGFGWFVPYDGDEAAPWTTLSYPEITQELLRGRGDTPKHVLIALDCCHSGAAIRQRGRPPARRTSPGPVSTLQHEHLSRRARILLTSALSHELARDGRAGEHSPFAAGFLAALDRGLAERRPVLASEVYASVYGAIDRVAPDQCPWRTDVHAGDVEFVFLPPSR